VPVTPLHNERELIQQVAEGSEAAFRQLFNQYRRMLYSYILKITRSHEMTEDLVQDLFIDLWSIRGRLPKIQNLNAYLHRMAFTQARKGLEMTARELLVKDRLQEEATGVVNDNGNQLLSEETRQLIQRLVDQLSPAQRQVFLLSREHHLNAAQIAERLNLTPNTIRRHLRDAIQFLREEISRQYGAAAIAVFVVYQLH
jgi:RNA polymerase sigma-70 factor (family 1)